MPDGFTAGLNRIILSCPVVLMGGRVEGGLLVDFVTDNVSRFGYRPGDIDGGKLTVDSLIWEEDLPAARAAGERCASSGALECALEYRLKTPSGEAVFVRDSRVFHRDGEGKIFAWQSALLDVTDWLKAESRVQRREKDIVGVVMASKVWLWEYSSRLGEFTGSGYAPLDEKFRENMSISREELWQEFVPAEYLPALEEAWRRLAEGGPPFVDVEHPLITHSGEKKYMSVRMFPRLNEEGRFVGATGVCMDITPLKEAAERAGVRGRRLDLLRSLSQGMMEELDTEELLKKILDNAIEFAGAGHGVINILEDEGKTFRRKYGVGLFEPMVGEVRPAGRGITARALRERRRIFLKNYAESPDKLNDPRFKGIVSGIIMPLFYGPRNFGGLTVSYTNESPELDEDFAASLDQFAAIASVALENARLHEAVRRELRNKSRAEERLKVQNLMAGASAEASGLLLSRDEPGALEGALLAIAGAAGAKRATLLRDFPERGLAGVLGRSVRPEGPDLSLPYGPAKREDYPALFESLARGRVYRGELEGGAVGIIAIPVYLRDIFWGFLSLLYAGPPPRFSAAELNALKTAAYNMAVSSMGMDADRELKEGYDRLQKTLDDVIGAIGLIVGKKDPYTIDHQKRVAALARDMGEIMGLSSWQLEGLRVAGLIHDVGKAEIPGEILSKPGRLSPAEFELVKTHARAGFEILSEIDFPWPVAEIVRQHHERLDGSGYPRSLKGEEIMPEARILAVADVAEAMTAHRPYRPSLGIDAAMDEIMGKRGILYDPGAADALIEIMGRGRTEPSLTGGML